MYLKHFFLNLLHDSRFVQLGIFDEGYVKLLLREHLSGHADHNYRLWILVNLELWYRLYFENESIDSLRDYTDKLMTNRLHSA